MKRNRLFWLWGILACVGVVSAQGVDCPTLVEQAFAVSTDLCENLERNQACYGNVSIEAQPQPDAANFSFDAVGDVESVSQLYALDMSPMDTDTGEWGVAVMKLQANLPDTLPGQSVTFILFGDVEIEDAGGVSPLQAFTLRTGIGDARCEAAPESGMLVQTSEGVQEVTFNINGVDVSIGSTILFQASPDNEMIVNVLEGKAIIDHDGHLFSAIAGTRMRMVMDETLQAADNPAMPELYDPQRMSHLPMTLLPRRVRVADPLAPNAFERMNRRLERGLPPCGVPGLPGCDAFQRFDDENRWAQPQDWGRLLQALCERRIEDNDAVQCDDSPDREREPLQGG